MIKAGLGQAEGLDTGTVITRVIAQCRRQLGEHVPQAGVVFAGDAFDHRLMLAAITDSFPGIELVGCTSAGELSSAFGFSDDSISLMVLHSDDVGIKAGIGRQAADDPRVAVKAAVDSARRRLDGPARLCFVFPDTFIKSADTLIAALSRELGSDCAVFGGSAANQSSEERPIRQFYNTEILENAVPLLLFAGRVDVSFSISNSWKPLGPRTRITAARGPRVEKIGDQSALDFLCTYLGPHTRPAINFPLAVYADHSPHSYLRVPLRYHPSTGGVTFSESIPQGAEVQLTEARRDILLADTQTSVKALAETGCAFQPAFAMAFSCSLRKEALGTRTREELRMLKENLPPGLPVIGFYGYGEFGPLVKGSESFFHNATLVTVVVGRCEEGAVGGSTLPMDSPARADMTDPSDQLPVQPGAHLERMKQENTFLRRKLARSEYYRQRLEENRELNAALHRQIIQEIDSAHREIEHQQAVVRKSEEKYRRIVETAGEGFMMTGEGLGITDVNAAFCNMLGYRREELLGKTPYDLGTEEFRRFCTASQERLLASDYRRIEGVMVAKDGRHVPVLIHGNTLRTVEGQAIGNVAFVADMTVHKRALALAAEVQKSLMPQDTPHVPGIDIAGRNISCEEVGGDYFDFLWQPEHPRDPFSVVVGDIAGHGVDAALLMTTARAFLRMRAAQPGGSDEIVSEMNRHLTQDVLDSGRFMTLFYLAIDPRRHVLEWVRAGHDPAMIYDPARDLFDELKGPGVALGVDARLNFKKNVRTGLAPGQIIAIGTDGIWEACNPEGEMFGKSRFRETIRQHAAGSAADILDATYDSLDRFSQGVRSQDDITLVIVKADKR